MNSRSTKGFSVVELIVTLAVIALLTSIAVPSMKNLQTGNRLVERINRVSVALHTARSEALKRGENIEICAARTDESGTLNCDTDAGWREGWIIYRAADSSAKIRIFGGFSGQDTLRSAGDHKVYRFNRYGFSNKQDTLILCSPEANRKEARALLLERSGRVLVAVDNNDNGIVDDINDADVNCSSED